jgi:hypothetical protein
MTESLVPTEVVFKSRWTFWCAASPGRNSANSWEMKKLFSFSTLAEFWKHFNAMKCPSEFGHATVEVAVFREGVEPEWDHEPCSNGGRWGARMERVSSADSLDQAWINLVLGAIGESIVGEQQSQHVMGVAYSSKGTNTRRIAMWIDVREKESVLAIGNAFKNNLRIELSDKDIGEMLFHDFESGNKSYAVIANTGKKERKVKSSTSSAAASAGKNANDE